MKCKILDCTLRDGGYYTNWDFDAKVVESYIESISKLPIDFIEIGYRSVKLEGYLGKYFYLPISVIKNIKSKTDKDLVIILNEKDIRVEDLHSVLGQCKGLIDMVRLAIDPKNINRAITLSKQLKKMGFKVAFNVMYMSTWFEQNEFLNSLPDINKTADYFYMVDSFGGVHPKDLIEIYNLIKKDLTIQIGFHGHNNLELALINTLTAIDCGVDIVDSTITGMGRGAGNLKTELLLTFLNSKGMKEVDFNALSNVVDVFSTLQKKYEWGTNLPYMVSGANSLPQKQVMEWVGKRFYSFNSIIRSLNNKSRGIIDNHKLKYLNTDKIYKSILIVGGGDSVNESSPAIQKYLLNNPETLIIHSSSRNAMIFSELENDQIFCLVGNEGFRMEKIFNKKIPTNSKCVLPPFPRQMGTYIPEIMINKSYELENINFKSQTDISHNLIAMQTAIKFGLKKFFVVGYDGYSNTLSKKEQDLFIENDSIFNELKKMGINLISLTTTQYTNLIKGSIYSEIE